MFMLQMKLPIPSERLQNLVIEEKKNFNQTCRKIFLRSDCTKIHSSITLFQIPVYKKKVLCCI